MIEIVLMLISFVATTVFAAILIPILKKKHLGQVVREEGVEEHLKKAGTPTMGGISFVLSLTLILLGYSIYSKNMLLMLPTITTLLFGLVGFVDDFKKISHKDTEGLNPKLKMVGLFLASVAFLAGFLFMFNFGPSIIIPVVNEPVVLPLVAYIAFAIVVMLGTTNAVNFTDGIDGLASTVCTIILTFFTLIAIKVGEVEVAMFGATLIGGVIAFLMFNKNPAKLFMGDTGSLALGGAISVMALMLKMPLLLLLVAIIPVIEVISVILQVTYFKITKGKRLFKMAPIHHHFELKGWSEKKVVFVFSFVTLMMCIVAYII